MRSAAFPVLALAFVMPATANSADIQKELDRLEETYRAFLGSGSAVPAVAGIDDKALRGWKGESCKGAWDAVEGYRKVAQSLFNASRGWKASATGGYSGDRVADRRTSKASISADFSAGQYPGQFRLRAGASLDYDSSRDDASKVSEDVTHVLLNYDHYFSSWLEGFGFVERFSDTFMSVNHRYEVGIGIKFEGLLGRGEKRRIKTGSGEKYRGAKKKVSDVIESGCLVDKEGGRLDLQALLPGKGARDILGEYLDKNEARFEIGVSIAVLAEFAQTDALKFKVGYPLPGGGTESSDQSLRPPGTTVYRASIRPNMLYRLSDGVELSTRFYYKPAFGRDAVKDGTRDVLLDWQARLKWDLAPLKPGSEKKVSLLITYSWYYDSTPDDVTSMLPALAGRIGVPEDQLEVTSGRLRADKRHSVVKLEMQVPL
jgi:hypothetical protein